jgi:hypothetical protein
MPIRDDRYRVHNELVNRMLILLHSSKLGNFWSNPTGAVKTENGHFQRYGLLGSSDIIGLCTQGRFIAIEIKTGASSVQSKHQKAFEKMIQKNNGLYFLVRQESDIETIKKLLDYDEIVI